MKTIKAIKQLIDKHGDQATQDAKAAANRPPGEMFEVDSRLEVTGTLAIDAGGEVGIALNVDPAELFGLEADVLDARLDLLRRWQEVSDSTVVLSYAVKITRDTTGPTDDE